MIQTMFDESAGKRRIHVEGSKEDLMKDLLVIITKLYEDKIFTKKELLAVVEASTIEKEQMVKEILERIPFIMTAAAMGDKEAQKLADRFFDLFKQDKDE